MNDKQEVLKALGQAEWLWYEYIGEELGKPVYVLFAVNTIQERTFYNFGLGMIPVTAKNGEPFIEELYAR